VKMLRTEAFFSCLIKSLSNVTEVSGLNSLIEQRQLCKAVSYFGEICPRGDAGCF